MLGGEGYERRLCWRKRKAAKRNFQFSVSLNSRKSPWRNRLACSAVNRKVGGLRPPGDELLSILSGENLIDPVKST